LDSSLFSRQQLREIIQEKGLLILFESVVESESVNNDEPEFNLTMPSLDNIAKIENELFVAKFFIPFLFALRLLL